MIHLTLRQDGTKWTASNYGLTPYWAERVKKQFGKRPEVDSFNRVPDMAQAPQRVSPERDFFAEPLLGFSIKQCE